LAASGLAAAAFALAFLLGRAGGPAQASPASLQPLRVPGGGRVLPHQSPVPALPTLVPPATKQKPVLVRRLRAPKPTRANPRQQPKSAKKRAASPAAPKRTSPRPATNPVVIVGSG
jgi:hypothetical protein